MIEQSGPLEFELPAGLEAHEPPEARGLTRDEVRMMVAYRGDGRIVHARFRDLPTFLVPGDLLVVNNSGTLPAALVAEREGGTRFELHLSTPLPSGSGPVDPAAPPTGRPQVWVVELRTIAEEGGGSRSFREARPGERLLLPGDATAEIMEPYPPNCGDPEAPSDETGRVSSTGVMVL